ncbi:heme oxygenase [Alcanivorax sp. S71-1-4]|uniref:biliverdin-producing heme oxygenase n=1 Tax=Alcanivorax sp. S71-1-4 TaxID=1177159 RepID=UPI001358B2B5|nr:biliverdin-producing heme oxygenase [Alcanivorax sp. S71-1-4]KAF0809993.1 heme oxygenase [Alcanivorax sp. S71-1-4]
MSQDTISSKLPLSLHLKESSTDEHERLDKRIMALAPFANRERYARFVRMQARLQRVASPLYQDPALQASLPDLASRDRLQAALADCADFHISAAELAEDDAAAAAMTVSDLYTSLGWLYTVEGSNLGAAFLLKHAREHLGLSETFGARHLAGHEDGRGLHWRRFREAMDALDLTDAQRAAAVQGALEAFAFARAGVEELLADEAAA